MDPQVRKIFVACFRTYTVDQIMEAFNDGLKTLDEDSNADKLEEFETGIEESLEYVQGLVEQYEE